MMPQYIRSRYSKRDAKTIEAEQTKLESVMDVFADAIHDVNEGIVWNIFTHMHSGLVEHGTVLDAAILALPVNTKPLEGYVQKYVATWLQCEASWGALALVSSPESLIIHQGKNRHVITGEINMTTHTTDQSIALERIAWRIWCCLQILEYQHTQIKDVLVRCVDAVNPQRNLPVQSEPDEVPWEASRGVQTTTQAPLLEMPGQSERNSNAFRQ